MLGLQRLRLNCRALRVPRIPGTCLEQGGGSTGVVAGFYSFGEIAPSEPDGYSALHNQTMTITALAER